MTDNDIWRILIAGLTSRMRTITGIPSLVVIQAYQPSQQGTPNPPFVSINRITANRHGFTKRERDFNPVTGEFDLTESYILEASYQAQALVTDDPTNTTALTAFDIMDKFAATALSEPFRQELKNNNIGIHKIQTVTVPYFVDDRQRNEQTPFVLFTLTYRQSNTFATPASTAAEVDITCVS